MTITQRVSNYSLLAIWSLFLTMCIQGLATATISWPLWIAALVAGFVGVEVNAIEVARDFLPW